MCNQKRGAMNQRREQSNSGRVGLRPQSEGDSRRCERDTRERKIPRPFFSSLLFLFIPNSRCSRQKSLRRGGERADRSLPWFKQRERQPHNQHEAFCGDCQKDTKSYRSPLPLSCYLVIFRGNTGAEITKSFS